MRSDSNFPIDDTDIGLIHFLKIAWESGWLDEYAEDHFLIKAIENRLDEFVGEKQLEENDPNEWELVDSKGKLDKNKFCDNFCINFSTHMQFLENLFGEANIKDFMASQMAAGKTEYDENQFFQALSEVSVLCYLGVRCDWNEVIYEPKLHGGLNRKNPEARFELFDINDDVIRKTGKEPVNIIINVEVKTPEFPRNISEMDKMLIPTVLMTDHGRERVPKICENNGYVFLSPRIAKIKDFLNSAASKFTEPAKNEFNLLYINWSYREFPSNGFIEAWALLTNICNGILNHPDMAKEKEVKQEVFKKISAVIVYTESLEGLMFSDFRYVWRQNRAGAKFRMWVNPILSEEETERLCQVTGMYADEASHTYFMIDGKSDTKEKRENEKKFAAEIQKEILENVL